MGLDGGTYITRTDVLRGQSWRLSQADGSRSTRGGSISSSTVYNNEQLRKRTIRLVRWTSCSLSGEPLRDSSIQADFLGNLYNKEAVLEFLLGKKGVFTDDDAKHRFLNTSQTAGCQLLHLQRSADVFDVRGARSSTGEDGPFSCPITDLSSLSCPFSALVPCGHMLSDRALRLASDNSCPVCKIAYKEQDVIQINGTPDQVEKLRQQLSERGGSKNRRKRKGDMNQDGIATTSSRKKSRKGDGK